MQRTKHIGREKGREREGKGKEGKQQAFWGMMEKNKKKKPTTNVHDFKG
jgi:hypothetical protein